MALFAHPAGGTPLPRRVGAARVQLDLQPIRWLGGAMMVLGVVLPHLPGNPGLACPLRTATGIPCPLCGMTTSVKATMRGDLGAAATANPFGILAVVVAVILVLRPAWRRAQVPTVVVFAAAAVSWLFELHRFHFV